MTLFILPWADNIEDTHFTKFSFSSPPLAIVFCIIYTPYLEWHDSCSFGLIGQRLKLHIIHLFAAIFRMGAPPPNRHPRGGRRPRLNFFRGGQKNAPALLAPQIFCMNFLLPLRKFCEHACVYCISLILKRQFDFCGN